MAKQEKNETNPFVKFECDKMHASKDLCKAFCNGPACESDGCTRSIAGGQSISPTVMLVRRGVTPGVARSVSPSWETMAAEA
jgi:hypothetical protein